MKSFLRWLEEIDQIAITPTSPEQKKVSATITKAVANDPNAVSVLRKGSPLEKDKVVGNVTKAVVQHNTKHPSMMGKKGTGIGDVVGSIDTEIDKLKNKQDVKF